MALKIMQKICILVLSVFFNICVYSGVLIQITDNTYLYNKPDYDSSILEQSKKGDVYNVIKRTNDNRWFNVAKVGGARGWIDVYDVNASVLIGEAKAISLQKVAFMVKKGSWIRKKPEIDSPVFERLSEPTKFYPLQRSANNRWVYVSNEELKGWIHVSRVLLKNNERFTVLRAVKRKVKPGSALKKKTNSNTANPLDGAESIDSLLEEEEAEYEEVENEQAIKLTEYEGVLGRLADYNKFIFSMGAGGEIWQDQISLIDSANGDEYEVIVNAWSAAATISGHYRLGQSLLGLSLTGLIGQSNLGLTSDAEAAIGGGAEYKVENNQVMAIKVSPQYQYFLSTNTSVGVGFPVHYYLSQWPEAPSGFEIDPLSSSIAFGPSLSMRMRLKRFVLDSHVGYFISSEALFSGLSIGYEFH